MRDINQIGAYYARTIRRDELIARAEAADDRAQGADAKARAAGMLIPPRWESVHYWGGVAERARAEASRLLDRAKSL